MKQVQVTKCFVIAIAAMFRVGKRWVGDRYIAVVWPICVQHAGFYRLRLCVLVPLIVSLLCCNTTEMLTFIFFVDWITRRIHTAVTYYKKNSITLDDVLLRRYVAIPWMTHLVLTVNNKITKLYIKKKLFT